MLEQLHLAAGEVTSKRVAKEAAFSGAAAASALISDDDDPLIDVTRDKIEMEPHQHPLLNLLDSQITPKRRDKVAFEPGNAVVLTVDEGDACEKPAETDQMVEVIDATEGAEGV